jgi:hypothetical protein
MKIYKILVNSVDRLLLINFGNSMYGITEGPPEICISVSITKAKSALKSAIFGFFL